MALEVHEGLAVDGPERFDLFETGAGGVAKPSLDVVEL
jgi:hypothetical protein